MEYTINMPATMAIWGAWAAIALIGWIIADSKWEKKEGVGHHTDSPKG